MECGKLECDSVSLLFEKKNLVDLFISSPEATMLLNCFKLVPFGHNAS